MAEWAVNGRFRGRPVTGVERFAEAVLREWDGSVQVIAPSHPLNGLAGHTWEQFRLPAQVEGLLWSPANVGPLIVRRQVVTIHDLAPLDHPEYYQPAFALWYRILLPALARRVRRVLTQSSFSRARIVQRLGVPPQKVAVIPPGVDSAHFRPVDPRVVRSRYALPATYVLFVGSVEPRKNLSLLLQAWQRVRARFPGAILVIAGGQGPVFRSLRLPVRAEGVRFLGRIPDADLPALYSGATAAVMPSLYEGFGLPVIEAMACGTPILCSKAGALAETAGEAAPLFDPADADELATLIEQLLKDPARRESYRALGFERAAEFPWARTASAVRAVLEEEAAKDD